jgi:phosphohistidine phosphatase
MKTLGLLRHAKSGWDDPSLRDFERPLSARGRKAARAMGQEMRTLGLVFDRIIASPAARVTETLAGMTETYGSTAAEYDQRVYLAAPATLLEIVRATDDAAERLLIVGHNPGMEQLALLLVRGGALRDQMAVKYPTAALAQISLPVARWHDVEQASGTLELFLRPRDLAPGLGPDD